MAETHATNIIGRIRILRTPPSSPVDGDEYFDALQMAWMRYKTASTAWLGTAFTQASNATNSLTSGEVPATHFGALKSKRQVGTGNPTSPNEGDFYYNTSTDVMNVFVNGRWATNTFTSTSTSTTTTSTSSSTTRSTSTSTSTTTTTTSTSTTTTL